MLKKRLDISETKRKDLQEKLLSIQDEWDSKMSTHNSTVTVKQQQKIKHLEALVEEQVNEIKNLEEVLKRNKVEKLHLNSKLLESNKKNEEGGADNENFILRREMDGLLKEKIMLSAENSALKKRLNSIEEQQLGSYNEGRSSSITTGTSRSRILGKDFHQEPDSATINPMNKDEIELRNKVMSYFNKRYPKVQTTQLNRSKFIITSNLFCWIKEALF